MQKPRCSGPAPGTRPRSDTGAGRDAKPSLEGKDSSGAAHTHDSFLKSKQNNSNHVARLGDHDEWFQLVIHFPRPEAGGRRGVWGTGVWGRGGGGGHGSPGLAGSFLRRAAALRRVLCSPARPGPPPRPNLLTVVLGLFFSSLVGRRAAGQPAVWVPACPSLPSARFPAS